MAARNLDPILPSDKFLSQLRKRIEVERRRMVAPMPLARGPSFAAFAAMAAAVVGVGVLAVELQVQESRTVIEPRLPGVIASVPAVPESLFASSSALAAAISTSAPVWSLAYVADQMPIRFATARLAEDLRDR
ncbi:MAG: hypothetical protein ACREOG_13765 [Gemmatimonadaceae bacterium]